MLHFAQIFSAAVEILLASGKRSHLKNETKRIPE